MVFLVTISAQHLPATGLAHHVFVTATSAPRVTDTVAWFPETEVTPPPPNATEMLVAAIKDFSRALKHFNLTGNFIPPTLVQDLEALASLHTSSAEPCTSPTNVVPSPPLVPAPRPDPRVLQPAVHTPSVQEIRVAEPSNPLPEQRVATLAPPVQESRVVLPTLAIANPVLTTPLAPLPIIALTSLPYPPPPGLPPLPNTDQPNHLLNTSVSAPTVPTAPLPRRSERPPKSTRTSDIYAYSSGIDPSPTPVPAPYIAIVHGDLDMISTPHLTRLEVAEFLSVADAAWLRNTDHLARANAASVIERFECMMTLKSVTHLPTPMRAPLSTSIPMDPRSPIALLHMVPKEKTGKPPRPPKSIAFSTLPPCTRSICTSNHRTVEETTPITTPSRKKSTTMK